MAKKNATQDVSQKPATQVITNLVRLAYAYIWKPSSFDGDADAKAQYQSIILIPKSDTDTLEKIEAVLDSLKAEFKLKNGKIPSNFWNPLRDGDDDDKYGGREEFADHYFIRAKSTQQPGIVGLERDENNKLKRITDENEVYSGCYARVSLNFFLYGGKGSKSVSAGIGAGLQNIQKVKDGERFSGRADADSDFDDDFEDDGMFD